MAEEFHQGVVENFLAEYAAGRTPNPCLRCNEKIKFAAVLDRAKAMGFRWRCYWTLCAHPRRSDGPNPAPRN
jgi:tRNA U34 2-thiouridine synthase MnmA/TrmU